MNFDPAKKATGRRAAYWIRTRRFTVLLLCAWFTVTFGIAFFARELSNFTFFGWSFSYYMAAQGAIFIYVLIVGIYAWRMVRLDKTLDGEDDDGE
jgi:putative solute:sodium symporter small subunit